MDHDLVQALDQTQKMLERRDSLDDHARGLHEAVVGLLGHYRETREGDVAYSEQGADRIDRTGDGSVDQKQTIRAALMAYRDNPTPENATRATDAVRSLEDTKS